MGRDPVLVQTGLSLGHVAQFKTPGSGGPVFRAVESKSESVYLGGFEFDEFLVDLDQQKSGPLGPGSVLVTGLQRLGSDLRVRRAEV